MQSFWCGTEPAVSPAVEFAKLHDPSQVKVADSPADVVRRSHVTYTMLSDMEASKAVVLINTTVICSFLSMVFIVLKSYHTV